MEKNRLKILTIIGARPQFIKAATLSRVIGRHPEIQEVLVHTGQHYDQNMSDIFFEQLDIPKPDYNLEVGSGSHGEQTGLMLDKIEKVLMQENPDWVVIYGDTNSTVAGSLAAVKLHMKVAHVEAGLRSFNRNMPEEINRIVTDKISDILFAPTQTAMQHLTTEGLLEHAVLSGDVMYDSVLFYQDKILSNPELYKTNDLPESYYLATLHRAENTDHPARLSSILGALGTLDAPVILPLHPRTKKYIAEQKIQLSESIKVIDPVGYLEMLALLNGCVKVLTDSGGLQKEAYFVKKPCITLRDETEWVETLVGNWNIICGADTEKIKKAVACQEIASEQNAAFGDGKAAEFILEYLLKESDK